MERLKTNIQSLVRKLDEADLLFIDYIGSESLPIKNWRGQPAPISTDLEGRLDDCIGTIPNTVSRVIKDAMETNEIFMKKHGDAYGIDECRMVIDRYLKALMRIGALKGNRSCEYGVVGNKFRMVKLGMAAEALQKDLMAIKRQLSKANTTKDNAVEVERIIAEVVASEMSKYGGHVGGRHGKTTRRNKRRSGSSRRICRA